MAYGLRSSCTAIALALRCAAIGCALGAALGGASAAIAASAVRADDHPYAASVAEASQRFGIPERWIWRVMRSEEHTSELQSLMRISYAVFCLKKKNKKEQLLNR